MTFRIKTRFRDFLKVSTLRIIDNAYARAFILLLFIFSVRVDTTGGGENSGVSIQIWSFSAVLCLIVALVLFFGAMKQLYRSSPKFSESVEYSFSSKGIFIRGASFEQILDKKAIAEINETRNYFLIGDENSDFFIIDKKQVGEQIELLRSLLALEEGSMHTQLAY